MSFLCGSDGKESTCNEGDLAWIPGMERSPGGQHGNLLQYPRLENPHRQEKPFRLWSMVLQRVGYNQETKHNTAQHNVINRIILRTLLKN